MSKDKLLNALNDAWTLGPVEDDEIQISEVARLIPEVTKETIRTRMNKLVVEELLTVRAAKRPDGNRVKAYKPADGVSVEEIIEALQ